MSQPIFMKPGGISFLAKRLAEAGLLHTDELTVTGKSIGEEANAATETEDSRWSDRSMLPSNRRVALPF